MSIEENKNVISSSSNTSKEARRTDERKRCVVCLSLYNNDKNYPSNVCNDECFHKWAKRVIPNSTIDNGYL